MAFTNDMLDQRAQNNTNKAKKSALKTARGFEVRSSMAYSTSLRFLALFSIAIMAKIELKGSSLEEKAPRSQMVHIHALCLGVGVGPRIP